MNTDNREVLVLRAPRWTAAKPVFNLRPHSSYGLRRGYDQLEFPAYSRGVVASPFIGDRHAGPLSLRELRAVSFPGVPVNMLLVVVSGNDVAVDGVLSIEGSPPRGSILVWWAENNKGRSSSSVPVQSLDEVRMCHPEDETVPIFFANLEGWKT